MSFTGTFHSVVECARGPELWTDVLRGDDPLVAFAEYKRMALSRFKKFDDVLVASMRSFVSAWAKHFSIPVPRLFFHCASGSVLVGSVDEAGYRSVVGERPAPIAITTTSVAPPRRASTSPGPSTT